LAGIVDFIKGQKTQGISDIYKSTIELLDNQQKQSQSQLELLINNDGLADITDSALAKLSSMSGMDFDFLDSIRTQQKAKAKQPSSFSIVEKGGKQVRIGFDKMGNIISETEIGEAKDKAGFGAMTTEQKQNLVNWMMAQPGFTLDKVKQLDEDPDFATFIRQKYNEAKAKAAEGLEEWPY